MIKVKDLSKDPKNNIRIQATNGLDWDKDVLVQIVKGSGNVNGDQIPPQPVKEEPVKPSKEEPVKPSKEEPVKPSKEEPTKPSKEEPVKPSKEEPVKPSKEEPIKPSKEEPAKPSKEEPVKPAKIQSGNKVLPNTGTATDSTILLGLGLLITALVVRKFKTN